MNGTAATRFRENIHTSLPSQPDPEHGWHADLYLIVITPEDPSLSYILYSWIIVVSCLQCHQNVCEGNVVSPDDNLMVGREDECSKILTVALNTHISKHPDFCRLRIPREAGCA